MYLKKLRSTEKLLFFLVCTYYMFQLKRNHCQIFTKLKLNANSILLKLLCFEILKPGYDIEYIFFLWISFIHL